MSPCTLFQLQFTSSSSMQLPTEIVKRVGDAAGVPIPIGDKTCRSSVDHFNLMFLVSLVWTKKVWTPDCRTVVRILVSSLACRRLLMPI